MTAVSNFLHPVTLSRKVMKNSSHCVLCGQGAHEFGQRFLPRDEIVHNPEELRGAYGIHRHENYNKFVEYQFHARLVEDTQAHDTVTAVAMDKHGHLACAASTGARRDKILYQQTIS